MIARAFASIAHRDDRCLWVLGFEHIAGHPGDHHGHPRPGGRNQHVPAERAARGLDGVLPGGQPEHGDAHGGNAYQIVNRADRAVDVVTLPDRLPLETIAAGATGIKHIEYGAVSQPTFTFKLTEAGCTDGASGQGLLNITVNSK